MEVRNVHIGKFRLLGYEIDVWREKKLPNAIIAKDESLDRKTAEKVMDLACYLYDILCDDLATHARYGDLPDTRKLISYTLFMMGHSEREISWHLGRYLGDRSTIYVQIRKAAYMDGNKTYPEFNKKLEVMREKFNFKDHVI